ncbi:MAG: type II CRISPR-associated endonuclease Cas1 [Lactobacillaceae bacterium]|jgi:CRISPR-associated protein Cas1|nr:type II CRISPR-associated endonuclease Cas1 [Lactobacillaceae bacterium]
MGWRIVQITKPCRLSVKNKQLSYEPVEGEGVTIPLEDISVLILENRQISLNNSLLSELSEYDIVLFSCDFSHHPSGAFFPFHNHSRYSEIAWLQMEASEPLKKRMWQDVVKAKICNQAETLDILGKDNAGKLREISKQVQSGDAKNSEAFAAGIYWKSLFENFNRSDENDIRNSALNYGYAILRGCVARSIVGAGLLPCFGIHHANKLNQFNLVDDIIEPFRPFVDYQVQKLDLSEQTELTPILKNQLVSILTQNCSFEDEELGLLKACENTALSVAKAFKNKDAKFLKLPLMKKSLSFL